MVKITKQPISPELIVNRVKTDTSGCVVTYVGLIRNHSQGKEVISVEYTDADGTAQEKLQKIVTKARKKWQINDMSIYHRVGELKVGDINLVVAVASSHREEGFAACQYAIDQFKKKLPSQKKETYRDGSTWFK